MLDTQNCLIYRAENLLLVRCHYTPRVPHTYLWVKVSLLGRGAKIEFFHTFSVARKKPGSARSPMFAGNPVIVKSPRPHLARGSRIV
jgi:hypothetical protein